MAEDDTHVTARMLVSELCPIVLGGDHSCLGNTPMIPLDRSTVTDIFHQIERLVNIDGNGNG